jgi:hypothetical protein
MCTRRVHRVYRKVYDSTVCSGGGGTHHVSINESGGRRSHHRVVGHPVHISKTHQTRSATLQHGCGMRYALWSVILFFYFICVRCEWIGSLLDCHEGGGEGVTKQSERSLNVPRMLPECSLKVA